MYDQEHRELFAGIRSGNIINNGTYMSYSTLLAIMGREAAIFTGVIWVIALFLYFYARAMARRRVLT